MSLFNDPLTKQTQLFVYEQELATLNAVIKTLGPVRTDHLESRMIELTNNIAEINAYFAGVVEANKKLVTRYINER